MSAFISPVADDPITKLQNLLQNTLYSFADVTITLAPEKFQALEKELKEQGITLPEGFNDAATLASSSVEADGIAAGPPAPGSIMDRVERLGELNDHVQATVDDLPDSTKSKVGVTFNSNNSFIQEEVMSHVKQLYDECQRATVEIETLYFELVEALETLREYVYCDDNT
ncbi:hypothetical protein X943_001528 [Babesia divergens]|uniref:Uncharacterized protein n=1 Tax=Babesia divergens TaxID=32595 RepID=A0AAD9LFM0_BABDI|nr:hypothetical protein X943_001528 [Babesia divergens]